MPLSPPIPLTTGYSHPAFHGAVGPARVVTRSAHGNQPKARGDHNLGTAVGDASMDVVPWPRSHERGLHEGDKD